MTDNISAKELILKIVAWRKKFLWISLVAGGITTALVFLMPKQYKSSALLFPARQFSISKLAVEANAGNQEDYMIMGDKDDCEKLMQLLTSDELKLIVADKFNLWERWKIEKGEYALHYLQLRWEDQVSIKRTDYNSMRVEVHDYTANGAAEVANGITDYVDTIRAVMNKKIANYVLKVVRDELDSTMSRMKVLEDSLDKLRKLGVLHFKEQVKAYSKEHAKALGRNDMAGAKRIESKLDTLEKYGSAYQSLHDNLERYGAKYPDIKMKYDEALVNSRSQVSIKFVLERARPDEFKAKPKRLVYIIVVLLAANLLGLFYLLTKEKFSTK